MRSGCKRLSVGLGEIMSLSTYIVRPQPAVPPTQVAMGLFFFGGFRFGRGLVGFFSGFSGGCWLSGFSRFFGGFLGWFDHGFGSRFRRGLMSRFRFQHLTP